jgi:23S rRNA (uracil1939-C5)-methyltransferase
MCRHADECGGCRWQSIAYAEQLRLKKRILNGLLSDTFDGRPPQGVEVAEPIPCPSSGAGPPRGFREKAAFVFGEDERGRLTMGHYAHRSHRVIPVVECPVHEGRANDLAFRIRDELRRARAPAFRRGPPGPAKRQRRGSRGGRGGGVRHLVIRSARATAETVAVLVATAFDDSLREPLRRVERGPKGMRPDGLLLNIHPNESPYLLGSRTLRVAGLGHVSEVVGGVRFRVSPTGFFQTNVAAARALMRLVLEAAPREPARVLDLYSGSGLFAIPLALAGHRVTAIEESRKASREAAASARLNEVPRERLRLLPSRVEDALTHLAPERFSMVVLDPPRSGCPKDVLAFVVHRLRPATLVLVSCNPEAFATEFRAAHDGGYRSRVIQPVDMFPHTPHIETLAILTRPSSPATARTRQR